MPRMIRVQIRGVDQPLSIRADKAEEKVGETASPSHRLKLSLAGTEVGEFVFDQIDGWWIEEDGPPLPPKAAV
jgi:hypothetical protein